MRTEIDRQLSKYFTLYEIMEGTSIPKEGHEMNWKHFSEFNESEFKRLCLFMDGIYELINREFISDFYPNRKINIEVTAGFRCKAWELKQGRSGNGMHPIAAMDIQPTNCSMQMNASIIGWLYKRFSDKVTGHKGGFAIKRPVITAGLLGFVHFDLRGGIARWEY